MNVVFLGTGGHFNVLLDIVKLKNLNVIAICDIKKNINNKFKYITENELSNFDTKHTSLINAIGFDPSKDTRRNKFLKFKKLGFKFMTLIHPSATVSSESQINEGSQILSNSSIMPNASIGQNCIVNTKSSVDHDSIIEDNVNLSPNTTICGNVLVKKNSYIGASATILNNITIGKNCHIFPGSVVNKNVKDNFNYINGRVFKS